MKKILVTGSSGTIGTRLCEYFLAQGQPFYGIDRVPNKWLSSVQAKTHLIELCDAAALNEMPADDIDMVIHLAANARVYDLVKSPELALENVTSLFNVLEFCRKRQISKFLFSSSRESYGNLDHSPVSESDVSLENCESPYAASKIAGEVFVHAYSRCYGIHSVIVRFSNVYGMYDESDRLVPLFIRRCKQAQPIVIFGENKCLDFTYIDDVVVGVQSILNHWDTVSGKTLNLSCGQGVYLKDVAELIKSALNSNVSIDIEANRVGEILNYVSDLTSAKKWLQFESKVSIQEGLLKSVAWAEANLDIQN